MFFYGQTKIRVEKMHQNHKNSRESLLEYLMKQEKTLWDLFKRVMIIFSWVLVHAQVHFLKNVLKQRRRNKQTKKRAEKKIAERAERTGFIIIFHV